MSTLSDSIIRLERPVYERASRQASESCPGVVGGRAFDDFGDDYRSGCGQEARSVHWVRVHLAVTRLSQEVRGF
ncbi:hypothetical protein NDU88_004253 [Pleurodeles waltl]|uniref:Uncharacterized protein n=1 Tax=Pleurodeles waltl TaxID=8319 RepID=A0AAV7MVY0_PLEWA|nr:hypothetical protein NDU88_004253 [Pleurodeles waltl]